MASEEDTALSAGATVPDSPRAEVSWPRVGPRWKRKTRAEDEVTPPIPSETERDREDTRDKRAPAKGSSRDGLTDGPLTVGADLGARGPDARKRAKWAKGTLRDALLEIATGSPPEAPARPEPPALQAPGAPPVRMAEIISASEARERAAWKAVEAAQARERVALQAAEAARMALIRRDDEEVIALFMRHY